MEIKLATRENPSFQNKFYDNILGHTKHLTNLLLILNGTGAVTVFTMGDSKYNISLLCFIIGVLTSLISRITLPAVIWWYTKKVYENGISSIHIEKFYIYYSLIGLIALICSGLFLFFGLTYGYNMIIY